jgi:uncharacterized protein YegJ (DUF2314 family)
VTAFEDYSRCEYSHSRKEQFSVKAPISSDGITEFIWISVTAMENQMIYGTLANQPVALNGLASGDRVRVPVSTLCDWIYTRDGQDHGGFSIQILSDLADQRSNRYLTPDDV